MRERFPRKKAGQSLSARHVNDLGSVAERFGQFTSGAFGHVHHGASGFSYVTFPPWQQFVLIISNTKINADDDDDSGLYLVKERYYSHINDQWETSDAEHELDGREFDLTGLAVDDKVVAFWSEQRGMFVPINTQVTIIHGTLNEPLLAGSTAVMTVYAGNPLFPTGRTETVRDFYLSPGEELDTGTRVKAERYQGQWIVDTARC